MNKSSSFKNIPVTSVAPDFAKNFPMILKVLHVMFGNNPSLEVTAHKFLEKTRTTTQLEDTETLESIEKIKILGKGLIISNHSDTTFADYLPLFAQLGDEVLKKCVFYNGYKVIQANRNEFKDYVFRDTNSVRGYDENQNPQTNFTGTKQILQILKEDIERIQTEGGYVFIIPNGEDTEGNFKGIYERFIQSLPQDFPILANYVTNSTPMKFPDILKKYLESIPLNLAEKIANFVKGTQWRIGNILQTPHHNIAQIKSRLTNVASLNGVNLQEKTQKYNDLLGVDLTDK